MDMTIMSTYSYTPQESHSLGYMPCSRGHSHPPWNTAGVLRIAKCESICGFCQKETKTAANLRKHVAIHIKNDGLNLTIAEGSSGRGRLFVPAYLSHERDPLTLGFRESPGSDSQCHPSSVSSIAAISSPTHCAFSNAFSGPPALPSVSSRRSSSSSTYHKSASTHSTPSPNASTSYATLPPPLPPPPQSHSQSHSQSQSQLQSQSQQLYNIATGPSGYQSTYYDPLQDQFSKFPPHDPPNHHLLTHLPLPPIVRKYRQQNDPFHALRSHNLNTKSAWTAIPASEGQRILDICKRNSTTAYSSSPSTSSSSSTSSYGPGVGTHHHQQQHQLLQQQHVPCYNRKTLYDEEWQAHMRDVHGVFLLWPDTWMKRVEVLDLDPFGGDIGACNGVIMDS